MGYATEWEDHGVVWRYWGQVDGEELLHSNMEIYGDERFDALKYQIVDLTRITEFNVTRDDMMTIAAYDKAAAMSNPRIRIAVVTHHTAARTLTRLYETTNTESPWTVRLFEDLNEARRWAVEPSEPASRT